MISSSFAVGKLALLPATTGQSACVYDLASV